MITINQLMEQLRLTEQYYDIELETPVVIVSNNTDYLVKEVKYNPETGNFELRILSSLFQ